MLDILELIHLIESKINLKCEVSLHSRDSYDKEPCLTVRVSAPYEETRYGLERVFTRSELELKNVSDDHLIEQFCEEFNGGYRALEA